MKKRGNLAWRMPVAVLLLAVLASCIGVDYVGQDFPPLPENRQVLFFDEKNPPPAGEYQSIGHAELTVPRGYDNVLVREKLAETARAHGASAVRIISVKRQLVNSYYADVREEGDGPALAGRDTAAMLFRRPDGSATEVDSFGEVVKPNRTHTKEYEQIVKTLMLMKTEDYQRAVDERRRAAQEK